MSSSSSRSQRPSTPLKDEQAGSSARQYGPPPRRRRRYKAWCMSPSSEPSWRDKMNDTFEMHRIITCWTLRGSQGTMRKMSGLHERGETGLLQEDGRTQTAKAFQGAGSAGAKARRRDDRTGLQGGEGEEGDRCLEEQRHAGVWRGLQAPREVGTKMPRP